MYTAVKLIGSGCVFFCGLTTWFLTFLWFCKHENYSIGAALIIGAIFGFIAMMMSGCLLGIVLAGHKGDTPDVVGLTVVEVGDELRNRH